MAANFQYIDFDLAYRRAIHLTLSQKRKKQHKNAQYFYKKKMFCSISIE